MQYLIIFFNNSFFILVGGITTAIGVLVLLYKIMCWFLSITPVIIKLGIGLQKREIAIFSSLEVYEVLKELLIDSGTFKQKNILNIKKDNLEKAKNKTIFLVDWESFSEKIEDVFNLRQNHQTPIIIYAKPQSISNDRMSDIANRTNTIVVNFRGRLLNDIFTSLITTSYDK